MTVCTGGNQYHGQSLTNTGAPEIESDSLQHTRSPGAGMRFVPECNIGCQATLAISNVNAIYGAVNVGLGQTAMSLPRQQGCYTSTTAGVVAIVV